MKKSDWQRPGGRAPEALRPIKLIPGIAPQACGSVLACCGRTQVLCAASIEEGVPRWMKEQGVTGGWLTAEYGMLPYSTAPRKARDISKGKLDGRSQEIQRLIGRSLRAVLDLEKLGPRTLWVDCDVLEADGGTRTTSITGACVAVRLAFEKLIRDKVLETSPLREPVAAVSVGIWRGRPILDLCYEEDKDAAVDMNVVMTGSGRFVEVQGSGEEATFTRAELDQLLRMAGRGIESLLALQAGVKGRSGRR